MLIFSISTIACALAVNGINELIFLLVRRAAKIQSSSPILFKRLIVFALQAPILFFFGLLAAPSLIHDSLNLETLTGFQLGAIGILTVASGFITYLVHRPQYRIWWKLAGLDLVG